MRRSIAATLTIVSALLASMPSLAGEPASAGQASPTLEIAWPPEGAIIPLGADADKAIGIVVRSNFKLMPAGQCGGDPRCGHIHMKIDPDGNTCNLPGRPYNSMNSDFGGDLIKARFGACPNPTGDHVVGILLADDNHRPVLVDGKPVTRLVRVTTR